MPERNKYSLTLEYKKTRNWILGLAASLAVLLLLLTGVILTAQLQFYVRVVNIQCTAYNIDPITCKKLATPFKGEINEIN